MADQIRGFWEGWVAVEASQIGRRNLEERIKIGALFMFDRHAKIQHFKPDLQPSDVVSQIAEISLMDFKSRYSFPHAHLTGNSFCYHTGDPTPCSARFFLRFLKFLFADKSSLIPLFASARPKCVKISMIRALSGYSEGRPGKGDFLINTLHSQFLILRTENVSYMMPNGENELSKGET